MGFGCGPAAGCGNPPRALPPVDRIVFITIDTLRADHLPEFGYPTNTAPFLTSLSARGVTFRNAFAHSATTGPSHASMFTSLYPLQHGVQNNGQKLDNSFVTVAEILAEQGFATAAFVSANGLFGRSQIAQGFAHYDQPPDNEMRGEQGRRRLYRPADRTTDTALEWLDTQRPDAPLFLWVHYYDPHMPLMPRDEYVAQVNPPNRAELKELQTFLTQEHHSDFKRSHDVQRIVSYDAEILFVDTQIARLFDAFHSANATEVSTLWVITSDHGQGLANHGWFGHHRNIYNEQRRVPLVFYWSSEELGGPVVADLVEHVDVPMTILDLVGGTLDAQTNSVQGRSLVPLLVGDADYEHKHVAYSERRRIFRPSTRRAHEPGERYSLQSREAKYLWFSEGPDEFYDLVSDPYETRNLIEEPSLSKDELSDTLRQIVGVLASERQGEIVDESTLERLRSLGYVR